MTNRLVDGKSNRKKPKEEEAKNTLIRGAQYLQKKDEEEPTPGTDGKIYEVTCYHCQRFGHYAGQCPGRDGTEKQSQEQVHFTEEAPSVGRDSESDDESVIISYCNHLKENKHYDKPMEKHC